MQCQRSTALETLVSLLLIVTYFELYFLLTYECTHSSRFTEEPSEDEKEEMDKLEAIASGEDVENSSGDLSKLKSESAALDWNLGSKVGIRSATEDAIALLKKYDANLPEDDAKAKQKVGPLLLAHKNEKPEEIVAALWKEIGKKASEHEKEVKNQALEKVTKVAANTGLVSAFKELSDLYSKEGTSEEVV